MCRISTPWGRGPCAASARERNCLPVRLRESCSVDETARAVRRRRDLRTSSGGFEQTALQANTFGSDLIRASSSACQSVRNARRCLRRRSVAQRSTREGESLDGTGCGTGPRRLRGIRSRSLAAGVRRPPALSRARLGSGHVSRASTIENRAQPAHRRRGGSRKQHAALRGNGRRQHLPRSPMPSGIFPSCSSRARRRS